MKIVQELPANQVILNSCQVFQDLQSLQFRIILVVLKIAKVGNIPILSDCALNVIHLVLPAEEARVLIAYPAKPTKFW
jgi:hypothetical protein